MRLHLFFFLNFGRYGRYVPSRPDFGRIGADFGRVGPSRDPPRGATRHDAGRTRGLRRPSRVAASRRVGRGCAGLGAASVHPCNYFTLKFSLEWVPPFQLRILYLRCCTLGPNFPNWIKTQRNLIYLDVSSTGISDTIPTWFWNMPFE